MATPNTSARLGLCARSSEVSNALDVHTLYSICRSSSLIRFISSSTSTDKTANADERLFKFNVSSIDPSEWTSSADLRIFKRRSKIAKPRGHFKIRIFRLSRRPVEGGHDRWKRKAVLVDAKTVKCRRLGEWLSFNVTSAVAFWAKWPSRNFGLWVSVRGVEHVPDEDFEIATGGRKEPILVTFEQDKAKKYPARKPTRKPDADSNVRGRRHRREIMPDYEERCQKRKMFVRFKDLQWHKWIVAPRGFSAYHCQGTCPEVLDQHYDPTNHAVIQNLLHHRYSRKIPAACCVPTSLHSISMLYFELDGSIVLREYSGMVASTCGCR